MSRLRAGGTSPKRSGYHHGDLRRALLEAGHQVVAERGVDALSLREVARRAEVSPAAPYHHFASKADLVSAIVQGGFEEFTLALQGGADAAGPSAAQRLSGMGLAYVKFAVDNPAIFRLLFRPELRGREADGANAAAMEQAGLRAYQVFIQCVQAAVREGSVQGLSDDVAIAALSAVHGLATLLVDGPIDMSGRSPDKLARIVLRALGAGITTRSPLTDRQRAE